MDPVSNPYAPGAGTPPPELAGRDELREIARIAVERLRLGRSTKSLIMIGLRGVGKTVLLDQIREDTEKLGIHTIRIESPESRSLPAILAPQMRLALLRLSRVSKAKDLAQRGLRALTGFAKALKIKYQDIEVGFDFEAEAGLADNGDLEHDLQALFEIVGEAAKVADTALVLFIDELQYVEEEQLASLITALHRCSQRLSPVMLIGAGLPQLTGQMGRAKSYAERLFDFPAIGPLDAESSRLALEKPAADQNVRYETSAVNKIIEVTEGYPYFLQEWGKHSWETAKISPISLSDVEEASHFAIAALDESFFRVRLDRLTPNEKRYLRAMAELGPGPHRSGDISGMMHRTVAQVGTIRDNLIRKGMIWSPNHGETAFTVPLFDAFMLRAMPEENWRE